MSLKLLNEIAPGYGWSKTGLNIYQCKEKDVEADILYIRTGSLRHPRVTFRWTKADLIVAAFMYTAEDGVEYWEATDGTNSVAAGQLLCLPVGTPEVIFGMIMLSGIS